METKALSSADYKHLPSCSIATNADLYNDSFKLSGGGVSPPRPEENNLSAAGVGSESATNQFESGWRIIESLSCYQRRPDIITRSKRLLSSCNIGAR